MIQHEIIEIFGSRWWIGNMPTVLGIILILIIGKQISPERKDLLAIILGIMLIAREVLIHPYKMYLGLWTVRDSLPLHLCGSLRHFCCTIWNCFDLATSTDV